MSELTEEEFDKQFTLRENHITGNKITFFETYGDELQFVMLQENTNYVWTMVDGEDGKQYYLSGYHLVNRINYIITNESHEGKDISVELEEWDDI